MADDEDLLKLAESGSFRVTGRVLTGDEAATYGRQLLMHATGTDDVDSALRVALERGGSEA